MNDQEKNTACNAAPGNVDRVNGAPANVVRRKLAKAALSAPVLMTLAPRGVLGQEAMRCMASVMHSVAAGGASASPEALEAYQDCVDCQNEYRQAADDEQNLCPNTELPDPTDDEAFTVCEATPTRSQPDLLEKHSCPTENVTEDFLLPENLSSEQSLLQAATEDCVPQAPIAQITAPQPVITEPATRRRLREGMRGDRDVRISEPSSFQASTAQPSVYTQPSRYTSSSRLAGRDSQRLDRRAGRRGDVTTAAAPEIAAPAPQTLGCTPQPAIGPEPIAAPETTTRMSRRELRDSFRRERTRDR